METERTRIAVPSPASRAPASHLTQLEQHMDQDLEHSPVKLDSSADVRSCDDPGAVLDEASIERILINVTELARHFAAVVVWRDNIRDLAQDVVLECLTR